MSDRDIQAAAPAADEPLTRRQKVRLVALVVLKRVRFIAILAGVGLFIGYWDTVMNYWDKWTQPRIAVARQLEPGQEFYCPMDPQVHQDEYAPNGDVPKCPICGMPLSLRKKGKAVKLPEGITGRVQLSPERIELAGIKTAPVEYRPMAREIKTVGYVAYDEGRLSRIVSRVEGYVEKLYVDKTFTMVHQGDPLAEIYSPELFSTAQELVMATREKGTAVTDLAAAARNRLLLLGVGQQEIDGIVASGKPSLRLVIRSPQTGYVVAKNVVEGAAVEAKMTLFEVADLSTVWIEADVYEKDIPYLRRGEEVKATVDAYPNRTFAGKLALVYPQLDAATRTGRVRIELDNPQHELRPGMFATVRIKTPPGELLVVPERAVIDTGAKKVVYVERTPGLFEGVEVELGPRYGEYFPVVKGLHQGDKVAAAGGFLIDAETRLNPAAASTYFGASGGPQAGSPPSALPAPSRRQGDHAPAGQGKPDSGKPKAEPEPTVAAAAPDEEDLKNIEQLPEADRKLALAQGACPITGAALGSMGVPVKIILRGQPVFLCCQGCIAKAKQNPDETLKKVAELKHDRKNH